MDKTPKRCMKILIGDLNGKVGTDNMKRHLRCRYGTGEQKLFTEFCTFNDLVFKGTLFPHKTIHKRAQWPKW
jgi:hypothetical protein